MLDCSGILVKKVSSPISIPIPYLDGGANFSKNYLDFYNLSPITDCSVDSCNYGNTCGEPTSISGA